LRVRAHPLLGKLVTIVMMVSTIAFTAQATFIPNSELATGESRHYHHGFSSSHFNFKPSRHSHQVTHVHADGTVHRHLVDDSQRDLDRHSQEPGCPCCWNAAIVVGVLPSVNICPIFAVFVGKIPIDMPAAYRGTEPNGPRRPPRPPSIA